MNKTYFYLIIALIFAAIMQAFAGCGRSGLPPAQTEGDYQSTQGDDDMPYNRTITITPSQALAKMRENQNAVILDVRTPDEFAQARIPGAILLPDYDIEERASYVLPDKNALILVYCRSGRRSLDAVYLLISMGYTNVYDFGGINSWPYDRE